MKIPAPVLWFVRKAVYVTVGSALGAGLAYVTGKPTAMHHDVGDGQHLHAQVEA